MTRTPPANQLGWPLTAYQLRILELLSRGMTRVEVARHLRVSVDTVKTHVHRLYGRLGASNAAHAIRLGFEQELLKSGPCTEPWNTVPVPEDELEDELTTEVLSG